MKAAAYLLHSGAVEVYADEKQPKDWLAAMEIDSGVTDDWTFLVKLAEKRMRDTYTIAGNKAVRIEPHCGAPTFKMLSTRYNLNGEKHECRNRRKR